MDFEDEGWKWIGITIVGVYPTTIFLILVVNLILKIFGRGWFV